jgi:hypothetical protein
MLHLPSIIRWIKNKYWGDDVLYNFTWEEALAQIHVWTTMGKPSTQILKKGHSRKRFEYWKQITL